MREDIPSEVGRVKTRPALLELLKRVGPCDASSLADKLGVSPMAVRQHLYGLEKQRLVKYRERGGATGRPSKLWQLTSAADHYFSDAHSELAVGMIEGVRRIFGQGGLERLIEMRSKDQKRSYLARVSGCETLEAKLVALAAARSNEGYMAEVESESNGSFLFVEHHCPICSAAAACSGLCSAEHSVFKSVLGARTQIERIEHKLSGGTRCVYRVTAVSG
jgi:predicted ArsR family transcriptional regulator